MTTPAIPSTPWNFSAGPGILPVAVMEQAAKEFLHYQGPFPQGTGLSVLKSDTRHNTTRDTQTRATGRYRDTEPDIKIKAVSLPSHTVCSSIFSVSLVPLCPVLLLT